MTSNERTPTELRDAYYELSMSEGLPDPEMLDTLIGLYPQYAKELTSFAVDLTVDRLSQDDNVAPDVVPVIGAAGSHAVSAYHNTIYNLRKRAKTPTLHDLHQMSPWKYQLLEVEEQERLDEEWDLLSCLEAHARNPEDEDFEAARNEKGAAAPSW